MAAAQGVSVQWSEMMDGMLVQLLAMSRQGSQMSAKSALKHWDAYAQSVLGYAPQATLPPLEAKHVQWWLLSFRNPKTTRTNFGVFKWMCVQRSLSTTWWNASVSLQFKVMAKQAKAMRPQQSVSKIRLFHDTSDPARCHQGADSEGELVFSNYML